jgi:hypothetical protein
MNVISVAGMTLPGGPLNGALGYEVVDYRSCRALVLHQISLDPPWCSSKCQQRLPPVHYPRTCWGARPERVIGHSVCHVAAPMDVS